MEAVRWATRRELCSSVMHRKGGSLRSDSFASMHSFPALQPPHFRPESARIEIGNQFAARVRL